MKSEITKISLLLFICSVLMLSCNVLDKKEDTGTTFPKSHQYIWQKGTSVEPLKLGTSINSYPDNTYIWGRLFNETEEYDWYLNTFNPDMGNCYDFYKTGEIISYEGNTFTIRLVVNGEQRQKNIVQHSLDDDKLTIAEPGSLPIIYTKTEYTFDQIVPKCDFGFKVSPYSLRK